MFLKQNLARTVAWIGMLYLLTTAVKADPVRKDVASSKGHGAKKQLVTMILSEGDLTASFPLSSQPQTVGSNVVYSTDLNEGGSKVGTVIWTGTYVQVSGDAARVSYLVNINITTGRYKGTLVASGMGGGVQSSPPVALVVLGGTGDFEGASGTVTWGSPSARASNGGAFYTLKLLLPSNPKLPQPSNVQTEAANLKPAVAG